MDFRQKTVLVFVKVLRNEQQQQHFALSVSAQISEHLLMKPDKGLKKRRVPDNGRNKIKRSRWLQFFILNLAIYPDFCVILSAAEDRKSVV